MDDKEARVRLLELAATLPSNRMGVDADQQTQNVQCTAELWYTGFVSKASSSATTPAQPAKPRGRR